MTATEGLGHAHDLLPSRRQCEPSLRSSEDGHKPEVVSGNHIFPEKWTSPELRKYFQEADSKVEELEWFL